MYYTGIGSRQTPFDVLHLMTKLAMYLDRKECTLRSGGAEGADTAFEQGSSNKEIFLPWPGFNNNQSKLNSVCEEAMKIAKSFHPYWSNLSKGAKKLQGRNVYQVLGKNLKDPSSFVICWTPDGAETKTTNKTGGTGQAIRIANYYGVPIYNLANDNTRKKIESYFSKTVDKQ